LPVLQKNAAKQSGRVKPKHSILLLLLILAFVGVIAVGCIMNYVQAANNNRQATELQSEVSELKKENEELQRFLEDENHDEYYEKIAREEYNYAKPGERVFYDSSFGNKK
jgi:cell division protein FtsL